MDPNVEEENGRKCGCCCCLKYCIFYILSFLVWIGGLALLAVGILNFVIMKYMEDQSGIGRITSQMSGIALWPAIYLIVIGSLRFIAFFLGCCGSIKGSTCLLKTFLIVLTIVFIIELIIEIAIAVLAYTSMDYINNLIQTHLKTIIENYSPPSSPDSKDLIDGMQRYFMCCGALNYNDYENNQNYACSAVGLDTRNRCSVPDSCCRVETRSCAVEVRNKDQEMIKSTIYNDGCVDAMISWAKDYYMIMGLVLLAVMLVMLFTIIFGFCILRHITSREQSEGNDVRMDLLKSEREYDA